MNTKNDIKERRITARVSEDLRQSSLRLVPALRVRSAIAANRMVRLPPLLALLLCRMPAEDEQPKHGSLPGQFNSSRRKPRS